MNLFCRLFVLVTVGAALALAVAVCRKHSAPRVVSSTYHLERILYEPKPLDP